MLNSLNINQSFSFSFSFLLFWLFSTITFKSIELLFLSLFNIFNSSHVYHRRKITIPCCYITISTSTCKIFSTSWEFHAISAATMSAYLISKSSNSQIPNFYFVSSRNKIITRRMEIERVQRVFITFIILNKFSRPRISNINFWISTTWSNTSSIRRELNIFYSLKMILKSISKFFDFSIPNFNSAILTSCGNNSHIRTKSTCIYPITMTVKWILEF